MEYYITIKKKKKEIKFEKVSTTKSLLCITESKNDKAGHETIQIYP